MTKKKPRSRRKPAQKPPLPHILAENIALPEFRRIIDEACRTIKPAGREAWVAKKLTALYRKNKRLFDQPEKRALHSAYFKWDELDREMTDPSRPPYATPFGFYWLWTGKVWNLNPILDQIQFLPPQPSSLLVKETREELMKRLIKAQEEVQLLEDFFSEKDVTDVI